jgi:hypothetical protein
MSSVPPAPSGLTLRDLKEGKPDAIGAMVREVQFRGSDYAIYRSDRGSHYSTNPQSQGETDGKNAYEAAFAAGQGNSDCSPIYFGIDFDPGRDTVLLKDIATYFQGH